MAAERARARFFGTTADLGLEVSAPDPGALFIAAGEALCSRICDRRTVRAQEEQRVELAAGDIESLLVAWLNEIIYRVDARRFLVRRCRVTVTEDGRSLAAVIVGEPLDPARHRPGGDFKAATWHRLSVRRVRGAWRATVVFDV